MSVATSGHAPQGAIVRTGEMMTKNACAFLMLMFVNQLDTRRGVSHYQPGRFSRQFQWCGESWAFYKGKCYRALLGAYDRDQAGFLCENIDGAELALPTDLDSTVFINAVWLNNAWSKNFPYWISPRKIHWHWTTGRLPLRSIPDLPFSFWVDDYPGRAEYCVVANYLNQEGKWSATDCGIYHKNENYYGAMCEKEARRRPLREKHCEEGWSLFRDRCYFSPPEETSYADANYICNTKYNAVLAHPYDRPSAAIITTSFFKVHVEGNHWISTVDKKDPTLNSFSLFAKRNRGSNTGCVFMNTFNDWYYDDCNRIYGFVCEKDASLR